MDTSTCPRCGATLRDEDAAWLTGPKGYLPVLLWCHPRPDDGSKCRVYGGPRIGGYQDWGESAIVTSTTLSAGQEPPGRR
jgi:hypothetical protein